VVLAFNYNTNLPDHEIVAMSASLNITITRHGDFFENGLKPGCGVACLWNGGGYYNEIFTCGQKTSTGRTFYCSLDCRDGVQSRRSVFISYRHTDAHFADYITASLLTNDIDVLRDAREIELSGRISAFMQLGPRSRHFLPILSPGYFKSRYCLFELDSIAKQTATVNVLPIIIDDVLSREQESDYIVYWNDTRRRVREAIANLSSRASAYLHRELVLIDRFPELISSFLALVRKHPPPEDHYWLRASCYQLLGVLRYGIRPTADEAGGITPFRSQREFEQDFEVPRVPTSHFYLHACDDTDAAEFISRFKPASAYTRVHSNVVTKNGKMDIHVILVRHQSLKDLSYVLHIIHMVEIKEALLAPVFLDADLAVPFSELDVLQYWDQTYRRGQRIDGLLSWISYLHSSKRKMRKVVGNLGLALMDLRDRLGLSPIRHLDPEEIKGRGRVVELFKTTANRA
jgi:hypothetical protein